MICRYMLIILRAWMAGCLARESVRLVQHARQPAEFTCDRILWQKGVPATHPIHPLGQQLQLLGAHQMLRSQLSASRALKAPSALTPAHPPSVCSVQGKPDSKKAPYKGPYEYMYKLSLQMEAPDNSATLHCLQGL